MTVPPEDREQPLVAHLIELRDRLLRSLLAVLACFALLFPWSNELYALAARPLLALLPEGSSMIATDVASPFFAPFKLTLLAALLLALPYLAWQVWAFVAPGLYRHERSLLWPLMAASVLLFYAGMAFAYFVVFPILFQFFTTVGPEQVRVMTDISAYLDFVLKLFFAFGVAFQVPVAVVLLCRAGVVEPSRLAAKRPYVVVGCFVVGMLLTPPDVFSQTLLAVPMWLLFEAGLAVGRRVAPKEQQSVS